MLCRSVGRLVITALLGATMLTAPASAQSTGTAAQSTARVDTAGVNRITADWPEVAKAAANAMLDKYGAPAEATESMLIWHNNGPWKRTIVYKQEIDHRFPMPHKDVLEQFIAYDVPADKFDDLAAYDGSVIAERTKGELSARCDKEGANFLAINLANDIVTGSKTVAQARQAYAEAMQSFMNGNPPAIMQGFTFQVNRSYTGDPGQSIMGAAATGSATGAASGSSGETRQ